MAEREVFVGRDHELTALRTLFEDVTRGEPRVALVTGPAGIGKTALVERFVGGLDAPAVLRGSGEPDEALVTFGVIDQLLRAAGAHGPVLTAADAAMRVGDAVLDALDGLRPAPVVIVVDDAHWADVDSLRALLYALRRLTTGCFLTLLTAREDDTGRLPEGLRRLASGATGAVIRLAELGNSDVQRLAMGLGVTRFPLRTAQRLREHTGGNPLFVRAMLTEVDTDRWQSWEPSLPAPREYGAQITLKLATCGADTRALVEACSVFGLRTTLRAAAALAQLPEPLAALEEATTAGLLRGSAAAEPWDVEFPHPLVRAAVYEQVGPAARLRMHRAAADLVQDPGSALRHRVSGASPPDAALADDLDAFARAEMQWGAWASAANALVEASRMSVDRGEREQRLLQAIDATVSAGDLQRAMLLADDITRFARGPRRDAALGYLAVLQGRCTEAESRLRTGWERADPAADPGLASQVALRWTLHEVGRLRGAEIVAWGRRAIELLPDDDAVRLETDALLGLGLGLAGRVPDGRAAYSEVLDRLTGDEGPTAGRVHMAQSWLRIVDDDLEGVPQILAAVVPDQLRQGSVRIAVWSSIWMARAHYLLGAWEQAAAAADQAVTLLEQTGHEWLRPIARWAAAAVAAGRGDWTTAAGHVAQAHTGPGDYELMIVAGALAGAELAWTRGEHEAVLTHLGPIVALPQREGIDEPGFWPWQHLWGDALVSAGRLDEAHAFLAPHERLAQDRGRCSAVARLARVRGRWEAAAGRAGAADTAFREGLHRLDGLALPFERAQLELAHGRLLRRRGRRRAANELLEAAQVTFTALGAVPFVEQCALELGGTGLAPAKRSDADPTRLTPQERAVAARAAAGLSNRDIAIEMSISTKTVGYHLGNVYAKLDVRSRVQLAHRLPDA